MADAAYDTESIRCYLRRRGIKSSIPSNKSNQQKPSRGRPNRFDKRDLKVEDLSSDSLHGLNSDLGGLLKDMRGSTMYSRAYPSCEFHDKFGVGLNFEMISMLMTTLVESKIPVESLSIYFLANSYIMT